MQNNDSVARICQELSAGKDYLHNGLAVLTRSLMIMALTMAHVAVVMKLREEGRKTKNGITVNKDMVVSFG